MIEPTGMPTGYGDRKDLPVWDGVVMYFPLAMLAIAEVSRVGNDQHNPGEPLHWAQGKSTDQSNTAMRHKMDHGMGNSKDTDGCWHLAKTCWRDMAALQLAMQAARDRGEALFTGKFVPPAMAVPPPPVTVTEHYDTCPCGGAVVSPQHPYYEISNDITHTVGGCS